MATPARELKSRVLSGLIPCFRDEVRVYAVKGNFDLKALEAGLARVGSFQSDQEKRDTSAHVLYVAHEGGGRTGARSEARDRGRDFLVILYDVSFVPDLVFDLFSGWFNLVDGVDFVGIRGVQPLHDDGEQRHCFPVRSTRAARRCRFSRCANRPTIAFPGGEKWTPRHARVFS